MHYLQGDSRLTLSEVFRAYLKLGVMSFGGPVAHLGYFHRELIERRRWLDERSYAAIVALCQFLPGPTSSQVGFSIGLLRAGYAGALVAWAAFTLPSAAILVFFAYGATTLARLTDLGLIHGLKLVAVAVVTQAVWSMARTLCVDWQRVAIAVVSGVLVSFLRSSGGQLASLLLGGALGFVMCRRGVTVSTSNGFPVFPVSRRASWVALTVFVGLLVGLPVALHFGASQSVAVADAFYRSGALVFGGGHVVLPLLRQAFVSPGWVGDDTFLAGYGAAQAIPGPLFTFAAFLGATSAAGPGGIAGAVLGLVAIFLPGMLLVLGVLPWVAAGATTGGANAGRPGVRERTAAVIAGINAAVVGLLAAALYNPIGTSAIGSFTDFIVAVCGFLLLAVGRVPPLLVVVLVAAAGLFI